ncbi:MAG TPA: hypothetical protein VFM55_12310 [Micromonosporaceae bacterium]|nr:hypothetical protein [Micromonosporaceae bacterium]
MRPRVARPTPAQRAAVRAILRERIGATGQALCLVYAPNRRTEATWLCAYARAAGVATQLRPAAAATAAAVELACGGVPGATVLVLADMTVRMPAGAHQLAGTDTHSPVDLWAPAELLEAEALAAARRLGGAPLTVPTGGGEATFATGPFTPGTPLGTVTADVTGADGVFVADAAVAVNRAVAWDARLARRPVTLRLAAGTVTAVECPDPVLARFLTRAVHTHNANRAGSVSVGLRRLPGGFSPVAGPVNAARVGVTLRLGVPPDRPYNAASADLRIDVTATLQEVP